MRTFLQDLRFALRAVRRAPGFSAAVIATVTLAVGASAAIFSVAHAVLLRQLPYRSPERLVWVWSQQTARDRAPFNVADFLDHRDGAAGLERLSALAPWSATLGGRGEPARVQALRVSADLFLTLGVDAALGRTLGPDDDRADAPPVVVLTHGAWVRRFGADPAVVGSSVVLDERSHTVVGVLGPWFFFPLRDTELAVPAALELHPARGVRSSTAFLRAVGRLAPGVTREGAREALGAVSARLARAFPDSNGRKIGVTLTPIGDEIVGGFRAALWALAAAVGGVLLMACANLANLTLARGSARAAEIATRLALGATRLRVARQLLTESLVLAVAGGIGGAALATVGVDALLAFAPADLPRAHEIAVDRTVLLFALAVSVLAGVAFGLLPAVLVSRADLTQALKDGTRGASDGPRGRRARHGLVAAEVGIAVVLAIVVGLFARSFANLQAVRVGFEARGAVAARVALPPSRYATAERIAAYQRRALEALAALPGVEAVGAVSILPLAVQQVRVDVTVEGRATTRERVPTAQYRLVTPDYLRAMGIPLLRGRGFGAEDAAAGRPVVMVNETLARRLLGDRDPLGAVLLVDDNDGGPRPLEVVGVVGDVRQLSLDGDATLDLYLPYDQLHPDNVALAATGMTWVVRGRPAEAVRRALRYADPAVPVAGPRAVEESLTAALAPRRFNLLVLAVFAAAALLLAATGIYATVSYTVGQRRRELAIRAALGARRGDLLRLVVRQGVTPALLGIALGLAAALAITRGIAGMFFGLGAVDPLTFATVPLGLLLVALAACVVPALRASRAALRAPAL